MVTEGEAIPAGEADDTADKIDVVAQMKAYAEQTTLELHGTTLEFRKLPAMKANRVWRASLQAMANTPALAELAQIESGATSSQIYLGLIQGFLLLDLNFVTWLQAQLFAHVTFTNANAVTPQKLAGAEETAFVMFEAAEIDEMLVRAFAVNFTQSVISLASKAGFDLDST